MRGRARKYPYRQWDDGQWHEIHPSEYDKTILSLRATFQQWAKNNRRHLITRTVDEDTLAICFKKV
jgi:hypothetical protein